MRSFTLVEDIFIHERCHHRLRFGSPEHVLGLSKTKRLLAIPTGNCFGYIRWRRNRYGTQSWLFMAGRGVDYGRITTFPGVHPGAEIWFRARGKTAVRRTLIWLDQIQNSTNIPLENLPESFWRRAANAWVLRQNLPLPDDVSTEFTRLSYA